MRRNIRHCVLVVSAIGLLVGAFAAVGSSAASSDNSATASAVDCSQFTGPKQNKCNGLNCEQRPNIPPCRQFDNNAGDKHGTDQPTTCKTGEKQATVNGKSTCLKSGQRCKKKYKADYQAAGFKCKGKKNKKTGKIKYKLKSVS
jgi:hypothetical protein